MRAGDLMIPISKCARIQKDRSIYDALLMLEATRQRSSLDYRPRVVFVHDSYMKVIGCIRPIEVINALGNVFPGKASLSWREMLNHIAGAMHEIPVQDVMYRFSDREYISEDTPIEEVFNRIISGSYFLHLVVTSGETTTGVIRLSDLFNLIWKEAKRLHG